MSTFLHPLLDAFHARIGRVKKEIHNRDRETVIAGVANHMPQCAPGERGFENDHVVAAKGVAETPQQLLPGSNRHEFWSIGASFAAIASAPR